MVRKFNLNDWVFCKRYPHGFGKVVNIGISVSSYYEVEYDVQNGRFYFYEEDMRLATPEEVVLQLLEK